jgi:hypothetical protein
LVFGLLFRLFGFPVAVVVSALAALPLKKAFDRIRLRILERAQEVA